MKLSMLAINYFPMTFYAIMLEMVAGAVGRSKSDIVLSTLADPLSTE